MIPSGGTAGIPRPLVIHFLASRWWRKANDMFKETNDFRMCAERNLIEKFLHKAEQKGIPRHRRVAWVKKQIGIIFLERKKKDGCIGCSYPCIFCRNALMLFDLKVDCIDPDGNHFQGKLDGPELPLSKLTTGQVKRFQPNHCCYSIK